MADYDSPLPFPALSSPEDIRYALEQSHIMSMPEFAKNQARLGDPEKDQNRVGEVGNFNPFENFSSPTWQPPFDPTKSQGRFASPNMVHPEQNPRAQDAARFASGIDPNLAFLESLKMQEGLRHTGMARTMTNLDQMPNPPRIQIPDMRLGSDFAAVDPNQIFNVLHKTFVEPVNSAERIAAQGPVHPNDVTNEMAGDALKASSSLFGTAVNAEANSLGVAGGKLLGSDLVRAYGKQLYRQGKSSAEIRDAINTKYKDQIGEDSPVSLNQVKRWINKGFKPPQSPVETPSLRGQRGGTGPTSGFPNPGTPTYNKIPESAIPPTYRPADRSKFFDQPTSANTVNNKKVKEVLDDMGLKYRVRNAESGSTYFKIDDPRKTEIPYRNKVEVRTSNHGGLQRQWVVDTSTRQMKHGPNASQTNLAGEPFENNIQAIKQHLEHVYGLQKPLVQETPKQVLKKDPRQIDWIDEILKNGGKF